MKKTYLALAVAGAAFVVSPAMAQDYQAEVDLGYIHFDEDQGGSDNAYNINAKMYFDSVSTANRPLSEAAFLGRNGAVNLGYGYQNHADTNSVELGANYWFNDLYVEGGVDYNRFGSDTAYDTSFTNYAVGVGYMVMDGLLVKANYTYDNLEKKAGSGKASTYGLDTKYVTQLGNNFVNLEAGWEANDKNHTFNVGGDYFFTNAISAGVDVAAISLDSDNKVGGYADKVEYGVNTKYFFTPTMSAQLAYNYNAEHVKKDSAINLGLSARF